MKHMIKRNSISQFFITCFFLSLFIIASGCFSISPSVNETTGQHIPTANEIPRFTQIASYDSTAGLALRSDGKIVCWGRNNDGIYDGLCDIPHNLTDIASIYPMSYAVKKDGTIVEWGDPAINPKDLSNITSAVALTRVGQCILALKEDGTVMTLPQTRTWVCDNVAEKAIIENLSGLTSISGNLGLKKDGMVVTWKRDENSLSLYIRSLSDVVAVSNQGENYAVLKKDGTVTAWRIPQKGRQNEGNVIPIPVVEKLTDIRAVSAGDGHTLALKRDGSVIFWNYSSLQSLNLRDITAISAGAGLDLALKKDGTIVVRGNDNEYGQLFTPTDTSNIRSISAGDRHSMILKKDGSISAWGYIEFLHGHEPEGIKNVTGILAHGAQNLILMNNTTIYGWGEPVYGPINVKPIPHPYLTLFGGNNAVFALDRNQNLVIVTLNATSYNISQKLDNVTDISTVNGYHTLALKKDGTLTVWGDTLYHQTDVPHALSGIVSISTYQNHDLALKNDGTVVAWGINSMEQTNVPTGLSDVKAVSAGEYHSLALKKDGTVVCWGGNKSGECNVPENLHDVIAISAGGGQSLALKKDGSVVAWGMTVIPDWYG